MLFFRQRVLAGAALALLTLCATASEAVAKPKPGRGFRLFASAENIFTVNRVQCRVFSTGQICATGSSTVGGGIWPRGTANQYVFGSGINIAGIIEPGDRSVNGFAGDTAGAFFNNTGGGDNSEESPADLRLERCGRRGRLARRGTGAVRRRHHRPALSRARARHPTRRATCSIPRCRAPSPRRRAISGS